MDFTYGIPRASITDHGINKDKENNNWEMYQIFAEILYITAKIWYPPSHPYL